MNELVHQYPFLFVLILAAMPFILYGIARIVSTAWYRSKLDFIRRLTHGNTSTKDR